MFSYRKCSIQCCSDEASLSMLHMDERQMPRRCHGSPKSTVTDFVIILSRRCVCMCVFLCVCVCVCVFVGDTEAVRKLAAWSKQYLATLVIPFAPPIPAPLAGGSEASRSSSRGKAASGVAGAGARAGGEGGNTGDKNAVKGVRSTRVLKDTSENILKSPLYSEFP